jgi:dGTPase
MTDNYAVSQHRRLFPETPDLHWVIWPGLEG